MKKLKRYLTRYYKNTTKGTECFSGVNILAFSFIDAQHKIDIHNKYTTNKLTLDGEFVEEITHENI